MELVFAAGERYGTALCMELGERGEHEIRVLLGKLQECINVAHTKTARQYLFGAVLVRTRDEGHALCMFPYVRAVHLEDWVDLLRVADIEDVKFFQPCLNMDETVRFALAEDPPPLWIPASKSQPPHGVGHRLLRNRPHRDARGALTQRENARFDAEQAEFLREFVQHCKVFDESDNELWPPIDGYRFNESGDMLKADLRRQIKAWRAQRARDDIEGEMARFARDVQHMPTLHPDPLDRKRYFESAEVMGNEMRQLMCEGRQHTPAQLFRELMEYMGAFVLAVLPNQVLVKRRGEDGLVEFVTWTRKHFIELFEFFTKGGKQSRWAAANEYTPSALEFFVASSHVSRVIVRPFAINARQASIAGHTFNKFGGTLAWWNRAETHDCDALLDFFAHAVWDLCDGDRLQTALLFNWIALVAFQCARTNRWILMAGPQGDGKSKFWTAIRTKLLGTSVTRSFVKTEDLLGSYNPSEMLQKLLLVVDEAKQLLQGTQQSNMQTVVASDTFAANVKHTDIGESSTTNDNCVNIVMLTNGDDLTKPNSWYVPADDRRMLAIRASDRFKSITTPEQKTEYLGPYLAACESDELGPALSALCMRLYVANTGFNAHINTVRPRSLMFDELRLQSMEHFKRRIIRLCIDRVSIGDTQWSLSYTVTRYEFTTWLKEQIGEKAMPAAEQLDSFLTEKIGVLKHAHTLTFPTLALARLTIEQTFLHGAGFEGADYERQPWHSWDGEQRPSREQARAMIDELCRCRFECNDVVYDLPPAPPPPPIPSPGPDEPIMLRTWQRPLEPHASILGALWDQVPGPMEVEPPPQEDTYFDIVDLENLPDTDDEHSNESRKRQKYIDDMADEKQGDDESSGAMDEE